MRVRTFPGKSLPAAALMILMLAAVTAACGGDVATQAGTEAGQPASTAPPVTVLPTPIPTPAAPPKSIPTPAASPVPSIIPTVLPAAVVAPAPSPTATTAPPAPTLTTESAATPGPAPVPQTAALQLDVTFPPEDLVINTETITVTGLTSPDATVSVNGNLVIPDAEGHFSLELTISPDQNPLSIEVTATSVAGEELSLVRTVIFVP